MSLAPDRTLLRYRLIEPIGAGGMGEVWRARDPDLDRHVAIKVLPEELADDRERLARFEREARLLASLSHPNIAGIHGLHEVDGVRFLVMELVPGEDLGRVLARGPLGIAETIEVGRQVARALEAAHAAGVIHRDLKPANVLVTPDGDVRLVDFGLARGGSDEASGFGSGAGSAPDASRASTRLAQATQEGVILGTPATMSPEQARGLRVDRRTDLWSLGCVLYECLTGEPPFGGETVADVLAAVLHREPDFDRLPAATPPRLERLIRLCLKKKPAERWRDAGDAILELDGAEAELSLVRSGGTEPASPAVPGRRAFALAALLVAVAFGLGLLTGRFTGDRSKPVPEPPRVVDFTIAPPSGAAAGLVRISPDGSTLLWTSPPGTLEPHGFVRRLDTLEWRELPVALGSSVVRFSPDSREVAVVARESAGASGWALVRGPADLSAPFVLVAPWEDSWREDLVWTSGDEIALVAEQPLRLIRIPVGGGRDRREVPLHGVGELRSFLVHSTMPDGAILGTIERWVGGYHQNPARLDPETGEIRVLAERGLEPVWTPPGRLVFSRRDQLLVADLDPSGFALASAPRAVEEGLRSDIVTTAALFSLSQRGDLVHLTGGVVGSRRRIVEVLPEGDPRPWGDVTGPFHPAALDDSQNGAVLALVRVSSSGLFEIVAGEVADPGLRPALAHDGMDCEEPVVSPEGDRIAGTCIGDPTRDGVWVVPFPGRPSEARRVAVQTGARLVPRTWLPDGSGLLIRRVGDDGRLLRLDFAPDGTPLGEPEPVPGLPPNTVYGMVSPDGRLLATTEWDGGAYVVRVALWNDGAPGTARPIARTMESGLDWSRSLGDGVWQLDLALSLDGPSHVAIDGSGRRIRDLDSPIPDALLGQFLGIAFLADGRVFAVEREPGETEPAEIRVVTAWTSRLRS